MSHPRREGMYHMVVDPMGLDPENLVRAIEADRYEGGHGIDTFMSENMPQHYARLQELRGRNAARDEYRSVLVDPEAEEWRKNLSVLKELVHRANMQRQRGRLQERAIRLPDFPPNMRQR